MRVRFTPGARRQFLDVLARIRRENASAAVTFRQKAEAALRRLERFPESGPHLAEFPDLPYREVLVTPYRFFYRVQGKTVWVVSVWHGAQVPREEDLER